MRSLLLPRQGVIFIIITYLLAGPSIKASAQAATQPCPDCDAVLLLGFNEYSVFTQSDLSSTFAEMLLKTEVELDEMETKRNTGESASGRYNLMAAAWSKNKANSQWKSKFNSAKEEYKKTGIVNTNFLHESASKTVEPITLAAWIECKKKQFDCAGDRQIQEAFATELVGDTNTTFTLIIHFKPRNNLENKPTKIVSVSASNLTMAEPQNLKANVEISPYTGISQTFTRTNKEAGASIILNLENFSPLRLSIKGESQNRSKLPLGTIIASGFNYAELCESLQEPTSYTNSNTWAPADGRSVAGSTYGNRRAVVPDLRGVFLRGLNSFYPSNGGASAPNITQLDPETSRTPLTIQTDATSLPKVPMKGITTSAGDHFHVQGNFHEGSAFFGSTNVGETNTTSPSPKGTGRDGRRFLTDTKGNHAHEVNINQGGDLETRPKNAAVYYYIKIN